MNNNFLSQRIKIAIIEIRTYLSELLTAGTINDQTYRELTHQLERTRFFNIEQTEAFYDHIYSVLAEIHVSELKRKQKQQRLADDDKLVLSEADHNMINELFAESDHVTPLSNQTQFDSADLEAILMEESNDEALSEQTFADEEDVVRIRRFIQNLYNVVFSHILIILFYAITQIITRNNTTETKHSFKPY